MLREAACERVDAGRWIVADRTTERLPETDVDESGAERWGRCTDPTEDEPCALVWRRIAGSGAEDLTLPELNDRTTLERLDSEDDFRSTELCVRRLRCAVPATRAPVGARSLRPARPVSPSAERRDWLPEKAGVVLSSERLEAAH